MSTAQGNPDNQKTEDPRGAKSDGKIRGDRPNSIRQFVAEEGEVFSALENEFWANLKFRSAAKINMSLFVLV